MSLAVSLQSAAKLVPRNRTTLAGLLLLGALAPLLFFEMVLIYWGQSSSSEQSPKELLALLGHYPQRLRLLGAGRLY